MLEHLLRADSTQYLPEPLADTDDGFTPGEKVSPADELTARSNTADLIERLGLPDDDAVTAAAQGQTTREMFAAMIGNASEKEQRAALAGATTPAVVKTLVGMLTAYDWSFVEQAKELRGYAVAKITEETTHPDARIRLRALELLGKVTEVALFTERVEVKQVGMSDSELDEELKKRLAKYEALAAPPEIDVTPVIDGVKDVVVADSTPK